MTSLKMWRDTNRLAARMKYAFQLNSGMEVVVLAGYAFLHIMLIEHDVENRQSQKKRKAVSGQKDGRQTPDRHCGETS